VQRVKSSVIKSIGYDEDRQVVEVELMESGSKYQYFDVSFRRIPNNRSRFIGGYYSLTFKINKFPIIKKCLRIIYCFSIRLTISVCKKYKICLKSRFKGNIFFLLHQVSLDKTIQFPVHDWLYIPHSLQSVLWSLIILYDKDIASYLPLLYHFFFLAGIVGILNFFHVYTHFFFMQSVLQHFHCFFPVLTSGSCLGWHSTIPEVVC